MIDNKIIHNYLDSQIKCIDELMENHLLTLKKIFHIINKAKKMEIKFSSWAMVEVPQLQPILLLIY